MVFRYATGEYILLLNNDTAGDYGELDGGASDVCAASRMWQLWERSSIMRDKTIQHAGVVLGAWGTPDGGTQPLRPAAGIISAIWEDSAMRRMYLR